MKGRDLNFNKRYCLLQEVGHGSSAKVYKGYCTVTKRVVGIKVLDLDEMTNMEKVTKEISLLYDLRSEYIISYYDSVVENTNLWIVMEYAAGGSVLDLLKMNSTLDEQTVSAITYSVLNALVYLHEIVEVVHRDIKAANILITEKIEIKVCDFGVSKRYKSVGSRSSFCGTPHWMSPEVIKRAHYNVKVKILYKFL